MKIGEPDYKGPERYRWLLSTTEASNDATVDISFPRGFKVYVLEIIGLHAQTDAQNLWYRYGYLGTYPDGDSQHTWCCGKKKTGVAYATAGVENGNNGTMHGDAVGDSLPASSDMDTGYNAYMTFYGVYSGLRTGYLLDAVYVDEGDDEWFVVGSGYNQDDTNPANYDSIRFLMGSGNIVSGTFKLYGVET
jgi:hypothetical protein